MVPFEKREFESWKPVFAKSSQYPPKPNILWPYIIPHFFHLTGPPIMLSSTSWKHGHQSSSRVLAPIVRASLRRPRPDSESFSIAPISLTHQPCLLPKATNSTVAPAFKPSSSKGEPLWSSIAMTQHLARRDPSRFSQNIGIQQQLQQHRQSEQGMDVDPLRVTRAVGGDQDGLRTSSSKRWAIGFSVLRILVTLNRRPE